METNVTHLSVIEYNSKRQCKSMELWREENRIK